MGCTLRINTRAHVHVNPTRPAGQRSAGARQLRAEMTNGRGRPALAQRKALAFLPVFFAGGCRTQTQDFLVWPVGRLTGLIPDLTDQRQ